jgi:Tfp pilus assembly protein PilF
MKHKQQPTQVQPQKTTGKKWVPYVFIIIAGFVVYAKTLSFDFTHLDDNSLVLWNQAYLTNIDNIGDAFKHDVFKSPYDAFYRPLMKVSLIIDGSISGSVEPGMFHFTNLALHILCSCFLFVLLIKLGHDRVLSLVLSLIFTVHPALTQAVAWIPGRNDPLLALFALIALISFMNNLQSQSKTSYLLHTIFCACAVFTKETGLMVPVMCMFYYLFIKKIRQVPANFLITWSVIFIAWYLMRHAAFTNPEPITLTNTINSYISNSPAILQTIGKLIIPANLSVYPIIIDTTIVYGIISTLIIICLFLLTKNRRYNYILFGLTWFIVFLIPTFTFVQPFKPILEFRNYLLLIGLIIILMELDLPKRLRSISVAAPVIVILSIVTWFYSDNYSDKIKFWENAVNNSPRSAFAHMNMGIHYSDEKMFDRALEELQTAARLDNKTTSVYNNMGNIYLEKKMYKEAEQAYKNELEVNTQHDLPYCNLGILFQKQNKFKEAEFYYKKSFESNTDFMPAYKRIIRLYLDNKKFKEAAYYVELLQSRGVTIDPVILKMLHMEN